MLAAPVVSVVQRARFGWSVLFSRSHRVALPVAGEANLGLLSRIQERARKPRNQISSETVIPRVVNCASIGANHRAGSFGQKGGNLICIASTRPAGVSAGGGSGRVSHCVSRRSSVRVTNVRALIQRN